MILGITGISGSGKHTVSKTFEEKGWVILDADKIAHKSYRPYTAVWKKVVEEFGEGILKQDDSINRVKLGEIVFNAKDPVAADEALKKLNEIVHPYIKRKIKDSIHRHFRRGSNIVVVVALWKKLAAEDCCEKMLLIKADPELRSDRAKKRDGISDEIYTMRIQHQVEPVNPDFIIENNGNIEDLERKATELISRFGIKD